MSPDAVQSLLTLVSERDPNSVRLAQLASLAAQIEPELLRDLRLALLPGVDAGTEADLWFSPLAQSRTSDRLVLRPDVLPPLREALGKPDHPIGLARAWRVLSRTHRRASAAIRREELLTVLALAHDCRSPAKQARTRQRLDALLRAILHEIGEDEAQGRRLARWASAMLPRLPQAAHTVDGFTLVRVAASLLLDGRRILTAAAPEAVPLDRLAMFLPRNLTPVEVQVRWTAGGLQIGRLEQAQSLVPGLPKTNPLFAQVMWRDANDQEHRQLLSWSPETFGVVRAVTAEFTILSATGDRYVLRAEQPVTTSQPAAQPPAAQEESSAPPTESRPALEPELPLDQLSARGALDLVIRTEGDYYYTHRGFDDNTSPESVRAARSMQELQDAAERAIGSGSLTVLRDFGQQFFETVFADATLADFRRNLATARQQAATLRLWLDVHSSPAGNLPWEVLFAPELDQFLTLSNEVSIVRRESAERERPLSSRPDLLRCLVVVANPNNYRAIDTERLRGQLLAPLGEKGIVVEFLEHPTLRRLDAELDRGEYQIVLFIGPQADDRSFIVLEDESGREDRLDDAPLRELLSRAATLRLVIIDVERLDSTASNLSGWTRLRDSAPAIITAWWRGESYPNGAFWGEVLWRAALGVPIDLAVREARKQAYAEGRDLAWIAPAVYAASAAALQLRGTAFGERPSAEPTPRPRSAGPALTPRVLVVAYDPLIDGRPLSQRSDLMVLNKLDELIDGFSADLAECSGGRVQYRVVDRQIVRDFPAFEDGRRFTADDYVKQWQSRTFAFDPRFDYQSFLSQFAIGDRFDADEFDEVWIFAPPGFGLYESRMAGADAFFCNAPPIANTAGSRLVIMGFTLERGLGEMLGAYGHRVEAIMAKVYERQRGDSNLWERFCRYELTAPGRAEVGTVNFAPNSTRDYDWGNTRRVRSGCYDWYNFPKFTGDVREVDASEWGGGDIRQHHRWWLAHLPQADGQLNGVDNNWWTYIVDPNRVGYRPGKVPPRQRPSDDSAATNWGDDNAWASQTPGDNNALPQDTATSTRDAEQTGGETMSNIESSGRLRLSIELEPPTRSLLVGQTYRLRVTLAFSGSAADAGGLLRALQRAVQPRINAVVQLEGADFQVTPPPSQRVPVARTGESTGQVYFEIQPLKSGDLELACTARADNHTAIELQTFTVTDRRFDQTSVAA